MFYLPKMEITGSMVVLLLTLLRYNSNTSAFLVAVKGLVRPKSLVKYTELR